MVDTYQVINTHVKRFSQLVLGTLGQQDASAVAITGGTIAETQVRAEAMATGLTAAGSAQGDALAITAEVNHVGTAAASTGVRLPAATGSGRHMTVINRGANALAVYPATGGAIDGGSGDAPISLPVDESVTLWDTAADTWYSTLPPAL
jgi:hypothetical protein